VTAYWNVELPLASLSVVASSASPPMTCDTAALLGPSPSTSAAITSPSGSVSLASTGRIVARPGRTPNESSFAIGLRFLSDRFLIGWSTCWGLSFSASDGSPFAFSGIFCSQSSTFWNSSAASQTVPEARSLSTTLFRFTR
jgi:hypothetical protein